MTVKTHFPIARVKTRKYHVVHLVDESFTPVLRNNSKKKKKKPWVVAGQNCCSLTNTRHDYHQNSFTRISTALACNNHRNINPWGPNHPRDKTTYNKISPSIHHNQSR